MPATFDQLLLAFNFLQTHAMATARPFTMTLNNRRLEVLPVGFYLYDDENTRINTLPEAPELPSMPVVSAPALPCLPAAPPGPPAPGRPQPRILGSGAIHYDRRAIREDADGDSPRTSRAAGSSRAVSARSPRGVKLRDTADVPTDATGLAIVTCASGPAGPGYGRGQRAARKANDAADARKGDARSSTTAALAARAAAPHRQGLAAGGCTGHRVDRWPLRRPGPDLRQGRLRRRSASIRWPKGPQTLEAPQLRRRRPPPHRLRDRSRW